MAKAGHGSGEVFAAVVLVAPQSAWTGMAVLQLALDGQEVVEVARPRQIGDLPEMVRLEACLDDLLTVAAGCLYKMRISLVT